MIRKYETVTALLIVLMLVLPAILPALGQGGTGKEPQPLPKKTTTTRKSPARKTSRSPTSRSKSPETSTQPTNSSPTNSSLLSLTRTRTNQAGIEFVLVPPGSFLMGSTSGDADEKPVHEVSINYSFDIGRYEVTQAQWQSVMGYNPSHFKACGGNCPVENVSWDEAHNFINKLNETNDGWRYRLPTEAEWEYACRAGTRGDYAGDLSQMAWYSKNSGNRTHAVGQKQPNAFGLYDMSGNVAEWCQDRYEETYEGAPSDGSARLSGAEHLKNLRVSRGGSWYSTSLRSAIGAYLYATSLRSAGRDKAGYAARSSNSGLRVVAAERTN